MLLLAFAQENSQPKERSLCRHVAQLSPALTCDERPNNAGIRAKWDSEYCTRTCHSSSDQYRNPSMQVRRIPRSHLIGVYESENLRTSLLRLDEFRYQRRFLRNGPKHLQIMQAFLSATEKNQLHIPPAVWLRTAAPTQRPENGMTPIYFLSATQKYKLHALDITFLPNNGIFLEAGNNNQSCKDLYRVGQ